MFYHSESSSDEELISKKQEDLEKEDLFRDPSEVTNTAPATSEKSTKRKSSYSPRNEVDNVEASPRPESSRPTTSNSRARAAQKALAQEEKRKARKTEIMTLSETPSRPSSRMVLPNEVEEFSPPNSPEPISKRAKEEKEKVYLSFLLLTLESYQS